MRPLLLTGRSSRPTLWPVAALISCLHGHGADATALPVHIGDHPAAFALLNILYGERGQFGPAQRAAHQ
jgi:hypothetical protein